MPDRVIDRLKTAVLGRLQRLRAVKAEPGCGTAGQRIAAIANEIFAPYPDMPLHRAIRIKPDIPGKRLSIEWNMAWLPEALQYAAVVVTTDRHAVTAIPVSNDYLFEGSETTARRAITDLLANEMKWRAITAISQGQTTPTWAMTISRPHADILQRMGVGFSGGGDLIVERMERAIRQCGAICSLRLENDTVVGAIREAQARDRPCLEGSYERRQASLKIVSGPELPDVLLTSLPGRRLDALVSIGPCSDLMTITEYEHTDIGPQVFLTGDLVTLSPVPPDMDRRWLPFFGATALQDALGDRT